MNASVNTNTQVRFLYNNINYINMYNLLWLPDTAACVFFFAHVRPRVRYPRGLGVLGVPGSNLVGVLGSSLRQLDHTQQ